MKKALIFVFAIMAAMAVVMGCGPQESATIDEDNQLYVEAGDFDVYFELGESFSETYMVFGFQHEAHKDSFNNFWISGLSMEDAQPIYAEHPDFYMCKSPGAARAQKATRSMKIISADSYTQEALHEALSAFENSFRPGGGRVAVVLEGVELEMIAAYARETDEDMMDRLPKGSHENFFLVESVEVIDALTALEES